MDIPDEDLRGACSLANTFATKFIEKHGLDTDLIDSLSELLVFFWQEGWGDRDDTL